MARVPEWRSATYLLLAAALACTQARSVLETNSVDPADDDEGIWSTGMLRDLRTVYKTYRDCEARGKDVTTCLKVKLVTELDRAARSRAPDLPLVDGLVSLVRDDSADDDGGDPRPLPPEQQLVETLPRSAEDKQQSLDALLLDRASAFLRSRSLQLNLGEAAAQIVEGRGRKNKMGGLLLLPLLMGGMLIPLALGGLALLAGKALLVAKIALVLSSLLGLRKLLGDSGGQHEPVVQVVSPAHHGHYRRSLREPEGAHGLAYRAHAPLPSATA